MRYQTWSVYYTNLLHEQCKEEVLTRTEVTNFVDYCIGLGYEITGIIETEKD